MRFLRTVRIGVGGVRTHPFRAILAALGVVFGVGAVVGMMAISEGARRASLEAIAALGIDNIVVRSVPPEAGTGADLGSGTLSTLRYGVTDDDIRHLAATFENLRSIVPLRDLRTSVYRKGIQTDVRLFGTTPELPEVTRSRLRGGRGRFLAAADGRRLRNVCVLGASAARRLFGYADPLGRTVRAGGHAFTVVGILENPRRMRLAGAYEIERMMLIPLATANALWGDRIIERASGSRTMTSVDADVLYLAVEELGQIENTVRRLRTYLTRTHERKDYAVDVPYELMQQRAATQRIFTIVMASIAAISLLVGGIGIMNIMLANIYERTREIGTRRALGARRRDILLQFLTESVVLTSFGGGAGVLLGWAIAAAVEGYARMPTAVTPVSVVVSVAVACATGVLFGTYPAWKAANLDPIEALRHE